MSLLSVRAECGFSSATLVSGDRDEGGLDGGPIARCVTCVCRRGCSATYVLPRFAWELHVARGRRMSPRLVEKRDRHPTRRSMRTILIGAALLAAPVVAVAIAPPSGASHLRSEFRNSGMHAAAGRAARRHHQRQHEVRGHAARRRPDGAPVRRGGEVAPRAGRRTAGGDPPVRRRGTRAEQSRSAPARAARHAHRRHDAQRAGRHAPLRRGVHGFRAAQGHRACRAGRERPSRVHAARPRARSSTTPFRSATASRYSPPTTAASSAPCSSWIRPEHRRARTASSSSRSTSTCDTGGRVEGTSRLLFTFNGRMWPYTERFTYTVGDSVRWRLVNLGGGQHPLHLHGFYFRVESRGDGATDTPIPPAKQPLVVTEDIALPGTFQMVWSPDRPGNWLFHCHKPMHMGPWLNDMLYDRTPKFAAARRAVARRSHGRRHERPRARHHGPSRARRGGGRRRATERRESTAARRGEDRRFVRSGAHARLLAAAQRRHCIVTRHVAGTRHDGHARSADAGRGREPSLRRRRRSTGTASSWRATTTASAAGAARARTSRR